MGKSQLSMATLRPPLGFPSFCTMAPFRLVKWFAINVITNFVSIPIIWNLEHVRIIIMIDKKEIKQTHEMPETKTVKQNSRTLNIGRLKLI